MHSAHTFIHPFQQPSIKEVHSYSSSRKKPSFQHLSFSLTLSLTYHPFNSSRNLSALHFTISLPLIPPFMHPHTFIHHPSKVYIACHPNQQLFFSAQNFNLSSLHLSFTQTWFTHPFIIHKKSFLVIQIAMFSQETLVSHSFIYTFFSLIPPSMLTHTFTHLVLLNFFTSRSIC